MGEWNIGEWKVHTREGNLGVGFLSRDIKMSVDKQLYLCYYKHDVNISGCEQLEILFTGAYKAHYFLGDVKLYK